MEAVRLGGVVLVRVDGVVDAGRTAEHRLILARSLGLLASGEQALRCASVPYARRGGFATSPYFALRKNSVTIRIASCGHSTRSAWPMSGNSTRVTFSFSSAILRAPSPEGPRSGG